MPTWGKRAVVALVCVAFTAQAPAALADPGHWAQPTMQVLGERLRLVAPEPWDQPVPAEMWYGLVS